MNHTKNYAKLRATIGKAKLAYDEPMSKHTYFKIGGPADLFFTATTMEDLVLAAKSSIQLGIPYLVLGGGSNVLVTDKGFRGLVIKNKTSQFFLKGFAGESTKGGLEISHALLSSESGVPANMLIRYSLEEGLAGLEDFLGLPGTIGGAIFNNSHHLGKLIGDLVVEVEVLTSLGDKKKYTHDEMDFAYDYSRLQKTGETVLRATFKLTRGNKDELWARADLAVKRRAQTQPLGSPSSGCIFKNFSPADAIRLGTPGGTCSAGYLIDKAGLKGARVGGAVVSQSHANFIVNEGSATYSDVMTLVEKIKSKIASQFKVNLELEIFVVGEK